MASGNEPLTTTGYISHHLQNLVCGFGENGLECGGAEIAEKYGFWAFHMDTVIWALLLGSVFGFFFWRVAKAANSGVPTRFQALIEMIVEVVDESTTRETWATCEECGSGRPMTQTSTPLVWRHVR